MNGSRRVVGQGGRGRTKGGQWVRQAHLSQDSLDGRLLVLIVITVWEAIVLEGHLKRERGRSELREFTSYTFF